MKRIIAIGIICLAATASNAQRNKTSPAKQAKPIGLTIAQPKQPVIPIYKATDVKALIDTSSAPLIINFWASWCGPCVREIPWFDSIIERSGSGVKLVLVSLDFPDEYKKRLVPFLNKKAYKDRVVFLDESNADYFIPLIDKNWTGSLPSSIFINNSKKYYQVFNHQLTEKRFEQELQKLIN